MHIPKFRWKLAPSLLSASLCVQQIHAAPSAVLPSSGSFAAGSGLIAATSNTLTVNQSSVRAILDWSSFSIGKGGTVRFNNGSGATLNRVTGSDLTSILGNLIASGTVYLLNPEGVLIGRGAHVNVGGDFVASSLNLDNGQFLTGKGLTWTGTSTATVINLGSMFSKDGSVFLIGNTVTNQGGLQAGSGSAALAAGSTVLLKDSASDQRVFVLASGGDVRNTGSIRAASIELKAKGGNIYALAGNDGGQLVATGTAKIGANVWLVSDGGKTTVTGSISAQNKDGQGGNIETSGHDLDVSNATVKTGRGGNWLLDPVDLIVNSSTATTIQNSLASTNVTLQTTATGASGPGVQNAGPGDVTVASNISWASSNSLTLSAYRDINVNGATITNTGAGSLSMRADNSAINVGTINFNSGGKVDFSASTGSVSLFYNAYNGYANPDNYSPYILTNPSWTAPSNGSLSSQATAYMLVNNLTDLQNINNNSTGNYALGTNIDLSSIPDFTPLNNFSGILEGHGQTISNLQMLTTPVGYAGLFGQIGSSGAVRNLNLTGVNINVYATNSAYIGALAGSGTGTTFNVFASGSMVATNRVSEIGGLIGDGGGNIRNSATNISIDTSGTTRSVYAGGILGSQGSSSYIINNSYATGSIRAYSGYLGGLVGKQNGPITNSYATGSVIALSSSRVGGITGSQNSSTATITNSYATGSVTTMGGYAGGIIGYGHAAVTSSYASGDVNGGFNAYAGGLIGSASDPVTNSYATGSVTAGDYSSVGGLIGFSYSPLTSVFATGAVTGGNNSMIGGLAGVSRAPVTTSYAAGAVSGGSGSSVGGLAGYAASPITVSYAMGAVIAAGASSNVGGLVGDLASTLTDTYARGSVNGGDPTSNTGGLVGLLESRKSIATSYSSGAVSPNSGTTAGGLIGNNAGGTITSSYWDSIASGFPTLPVGSGSSTGISPLTTAQLQSNTMPTGFNMSNSVWVAPQGVYPYFGWQGPLVTISGTAYDGSTVIGNASVGVISRGASLASVSTSSGGFYSIQQPSNMVSGGVLTYLQTNGTANTFSDGASGYVGMDLHLDTVSLLNGSYNKLSALNAALNATLGSNTGSNFLFSAPGGILNVNSGANLQVNTSTSVFNVDQSLTAPGNVQINANGALSIASGSQIAAGPADNIALTAGTSFTNNAGAMALTVSGGGRWLVYSQNPTDDNRGGLAYDFKQYNAAYGSTAPAQATGNGFLYTIAPVLGVTLSGNASKTYDGTTTGSLSGALINAAGVLDGDSVVLNGSSLTYSDQNVGAGKMVTVDGLRIQSATNGNAKIYGYQFSVTSTSSEIGTISPLVVSLPSETWQLGQPFPAFPEGYSGPISTSLQQIITNLQLVSTAGASRDAAGAYPVTAALPPNLVGDITLTPGTLTIIEPSVPSLIEEPLVLLPSTPATVIAETDSVEPASLNTVPLPPLLRVVRLSSANEALLPTNAIGSFQIAISPSDFWNASGGSSPVNKRGNLASSSFTEASPDGRSKDNKSVYAAGARQ